MITIIGRRLVIPDCDRVLGVAGDKNIPVKVKVSADTLNRYFDGKKYGDIAVILKLKHEKEAVELAPILCTHGDDGVYVGDVSLISTVEKGLVTCQALLIAPGSAAVDFNLNDAEGLWQSDEDYFYISDDIELKDYASGSDVYNVFQNLLGTIANKITDINKAKEDAESARNDAVSAKDNIDKKVSEFIAAYGEFDEQAAKATEHYNSRSNPHEVTAEQVGTYDKSYIDLYIESIFTELHDHKTNNGNPHRVTANQVGAYDMEHTYSREEVYNKSEINLMLEEHGGGGASVEVDELLDVNSNNPVANKVLYAKFASIDGKIGDIDTALDAILDIQANLTGMADVELPWEPDVGGDA